MCVRSYGKLRVQTQTPNNGLIPSLSGEHRLQRASLRLPHPVAEFRAGGLSSRSARLRESPGSVTPGKLLDSWRSMRGRRNSEEGHGGQAHTRSSPPCVLDIESGKRLSALYKDSRRKSCAHGKCRCCVSEMTTNAVHADTLTDGHTQQTPTPPSLPHATCITVRN